MRPRDIYFNGDYVSLVYIVVVATMIIIVIVMIMMSE